MPLNRITEGKPPTDRQLSILQFIRDYIVRHDRPPTLREICGHLSITSPNGVVCHIHALLKRGLLRPTHRHTHKGFRRTQYIPADAEVVVEPVNDTHVRVATTGPLVMPRAEYVAWLRAQLVAMAPEVSA